MADTIIDWILPSGVGGIHGVAADQTAPVGQSERGRNPQIVGGLPHPPPWQPTPGAGGVGVGTPGFSARGAFGEEVVFDTVPTPVEPPAPLEISTPSAIIGGFETALYDRIHLIPKNVALGNVLQDQQFDVEVWNAFAVQQTLDSIGGTGTTGITIVSPNPPGNPPADFPGYSSFIYQVQVDRDGPASIDAQFAFDFTVEAPVLSITGTRIITLAFVPQRPIVEALEWKTDVLEAYAGREYRSRTRNLPRQLFEMEYLEARPRERSRFLNHLIGHHGGFFAVPVWHFARPLLQDASVSDTTIFVDTTNADFRDSTADVQSLIILVRDSNDFEVAQIAVGGLQPGQIDLERPLEQDHGGAITDVIPLQIMLSQDPLEWDLTPNGSLSVSAKWLAEEVVDLAESDGNLTLYKGHPVLTGFNYVDETLDEKITIKYDLFDNESGAFEPIQKRTVPEYETQKGFETDTVQDAWDLRKLIYALRGKQRSFYMPTWRSDFVPTSTIGAADLNITIQSADHQRFWVGEDPFASVAIILKDGTQFFRDIVDINPGATLDEEVLSINTSLGQVVNPDDVMFISYLLLCRLGSDRITLRHRFKDGVVTVRTPVIGVRQ